MANLKNEIVYSFEDLEEKLIGNPYPFYEELLTYNCPVYALDCKKSGRKILLLAHYNDVFDILSKSEEISSNPNFLTPNKEKGFGDLFISNIDGPHHAKLRKIFLNFFTKNMYSEIESFLINYLPSLINWVGTQNEIDLIPHIAETIPLAVVGQIMGIENIAELKEVRKWTTDLNLLMDDFINETRFVFSAEKSQSSKLISKYSEYLIQQRVKNLSNDLVSHIIRECRIEKLNDEIILSNVIFMLIASQDTTVNMIANGILSLLNHPNELAKLAKNSHLARNATEEILRFESPKQRATYRLSKNDIELKHFNIPRNTQIMAFLGAANRDPSKFEEPDLFNITRNVVPNLAFGHGIHNCLGKALARLEGDLVFPALTGYLTEVKLKNNIQTWRKNSLFRIPNSLVVSPY